ncbi:hypothetical protein QAD02_002299 [Eretmocerus hayati]|uniref:Uncharacterized protein n=1 Tax=Eretmocerus hayati TaxID=131215 RepID=A0ACC2NNC6_9HYME|nr:hypothetical protein QAD02_002299 [Eretmocerus hayati]
MGKSDGPVQHSPNKNDQQPTERERELHEHLQQMTVQAQSTSSENEVSRRQMADLQQASETMKARLAALTAQQQPSTVVNITSTRNDENALAASLSGVTLPNPASVADLPQNNQFNAHIPQVSNQNRNESINLELMNGMISNLQNLYIDVPLLLFDGDRENPLRFLENLEKYFIRRNTPERHKLLVVEGALTGKAKTWFDHRLEPFANYQTFRTQFTHDMYSLEKRTKEKNEWVTRRFCAKDGSLYEYLVRQMKAPKYFDPNMSTFERNYNIIRQLPSHVQKMLATVEYGDSDKLLATSQRTDESHDDKRESPQNRFHSRVSHMNNDYDRGNNFRSDSEGRWYQNRDKRQDEGHDGGGKYRSNSEHENRTPYSEPPNRRDETLVITNATI